MEEGEAGSRSWEVEAGESPAGPLRCRCGAGAEVAGGPLQLRPERVGAQRRVSGNLWPSGEEVEEGAPGQGVEEEGPPSEEEEEGEHPKKTKIRRQQKQWNYWKCNTQR